jgi:uncharacterized protein
MQKLITSKYLQIVPRSTDYAVYHSLFGNLELIDAEGINLLEAFRTSKSINEMAAAYNEYEFSTIWSYINDLRTRSFLVQEGSIEYDLIEADYNRRKQYLKKGNLIRTLQLVVTNQCNFACKYCFVDKMYASQKRIELQHHPANMKMSVDIAIQSVNNLLAIIEGNGNTHLTIEFFGGEPLMNWPVIEAVLETFKNGNSNGIKIVYSITTNGYLITKKMAEVFKKYGVTVTVSFYAHRKTGQSVADKVKGGNRIKRNLEILKKNDNWVTFNTVLSKETIDAYDRKYLIDISKYYNVSMIGLILDLDLEFYQKKANKEKVLKELWLTYQYGQSQGMPIVGYWYQIFSQIIGQQSVNLLSGYKTCPATGCKLSVEPQGHVFICKCCSEHIGHISDLGYVLATPQFEAYAMRAYRNSTECQGCEIENFCSGVCMGSLEKKYNRLDVIEKSSCDVFKGITKKLIENLNTKDVDVNYLSVNS